MENMEMLSSCSALGKKVRPTVTNSARGIPVLRDPSIEALQKNQQRNLCQQFLLLQQIEP